MTIFTNTKTAERSLPDLREPNDFVSSVRHFDNVLDSFGEVVLLHASFNKRLSRSEREQLQFQRQAAMRSQTSKPIGEVFLLVASLYNCSH